MRLNRFQVNWGMKLIFQKFQSTKDKNLVYVYEGWVTFIKSMKKYRRANKNSWWHWSKLFIEFRTLNSCINLFLASSESPVNQKTVAICRWTFFLMHCINSMWTIQGSSFFIIKFMKIQKPNENLWECMKIYENKTKLLEYPVLRLFQCVNLFIENVVCITSFYETFWMLSLITSTCFKLFQ